MCYGSIKRGVINSDLGEQGKWHKAHEIYVDCSFISTVIQCLSVLQALLLGLDAYLVMDKTNTVLDIIELSPVGESEVKLKEENLVN